MTQKKSSSRKNSKHPDFQSLTERQKLIYQAIRTATLAKGYSPSIREIGDSVGLKSTSSVAYQLKILEEKGFLRREPHTPRAFNIRSLDSATNSHASSRTSTAASAQKEPESVAAHSPESREFNSVQLVYVPVLGAIAAGSPTIAEENIEEYLPFPQTLMPDGELFALKVQGVSMTTAGILDGDWVVVRQQSEAHNGDIVAASFEGDGDNLDATVKEYFIDHAQHRWLIPHYPEDYDGFEETSRRSADNARILGKVVSVFRSL